MADIELYDDEILDDVIEDDLIEEDKVIEDEIDDTHNVADKREVLESKYNVYNETYDEIVSLLKGIVEKGEITQDDKDNMSIINDKYNDSYLDLNQELYTARDIIDENKWEELKANMVTNSQEDVFNALTNNGSVQGLFMDDDGNIFLNAQFLQTRGLNVVNDENEVTLSIDDTGNLTTSGDIVGGTITGTKLQALTIDTNEVNIESQDGGMVLKGALQKFTDENGKVRILIGKDTDGLFKFILYGDDGESVLIDKNGIKAGAIASGTITGGHITSDSISSKHIKTEVFETIDAKIDSATIGKADIEDLNAINATVENLKAENVTISGKLDATKAQIGELKANKADITELNAIKGNITHLESEVAKIGVLESDVADIEELLAGNLTAENIQAGTITAGSGIIADGAIGNAQISSLDAGKISAGKIDTSLVEIAGNNNHLKLKGNRIQVFQGTGNQAKERVSLGDVNGDGTLYGLRVRGADGTTVLIDENGVKSEGITDGSITNEKINENANIDGDKININSVVDKINEDGTKSIVGTKINVGDGSLTAKLSKITEKQTEHTESIKQAQADIKANETQISLKVSEQVYEKDKSETNTKFSNVNSEISAMKGQIALKVEQSDIETAIGELEGTMDSKIDTAKAEIKVTTDKISQNVTNLSQTVSTKADGSTVTAISNKVGALETSVNGISGKVTNLEKTTTTLNENVEGVKGEVSTLKSDVASLEVTTSGISQKVSSVESTTKTLTTQVGTAQDTANQAKADASSANTNATNAMNKANSANTLADSKAKVFTSQPTVPYKLGDLWVQGTTGDVMKCKTARTTGSYTASDWEKASKYTDDTKANAVEGKVTVLEGTVSSTNSKVAEITTNLEGITQRVSSTESTTATLTKKVNTVEGTANTAKSTADSAKTNATDAMNKANTANSKIDNLNISDRNLIKNSDVFITTGSNTNTCTVSEDFITLFNNNPNKKMSISLEVSATNALSTNTSGNKRIGCEITVTYTDGTNGYFGTWKTLTGTGINLNKQRISTIATIPNKQIKSASICGLYIQGLTSGTVKIGKPKYQISDKVSDWSPAPEDIDSAIDTVTQEITKTNSKVSSIETNLGSITSRVSSVEQTTTTINGKVTSLETWKKSAEQKITDSAIISTVKASKNSDGKNTFAQQSDITQLNDSWTAKFNDGYNQGITTINKDGITVTASNVKSKTNMNANGFKITKTDTNEDVFKVNSDGTLSIKGKIEVGSSVPTGVLNGVVADANLSTAIKNGASAGTSAKNQVDNWTYSGTTEINGNSIRTGTLSASKITTGTLDATKVSVTNLNASNITSGTLSASRISTDTLRGKTIIGGVIDGGILKSQKSVTGGTNKVHIEGAKFTSSIETTTDTKVVDIEGNTITLEQRYAVGTNKGTKTIIDYTGVTVYDEDGYAPAIQLFSHGNVNGGNVGQFNGNVGVTGNLKVGGTITGSLSGNASSATTANTAATLKTARTINGTSFNGSANITTANWGTGRTITIGKTGKSVNGSANVSWSLAEIGALPLTGGTMAGTLVFSEGVIRLANSVSSLQAKDTNGENRNLAYISGSDNSYFGKGLYDAGIGGTIICGNNVTLRSKKDVLIQCGGTTSATNTNTLEFTSIDGNGFFRPTVTSVTRLGSLNFLWNILYSKNGVNQSSDRNLKENIRYVDESLPNQLAESPSKENDITSEELYNFVKDDLFLAKYNFIGETEEKIGFIAQDLLYNTDGTDNKIGQIIVSTKDSARANAPLSYNVGNYVNVLAGALKQAILKIEDLEKRLGEKI